MTAIGVDRAVRRLRGMRQAGEEYGEQERMARIYVKDTSVDWRTLLSEAAKPGPDERGTDD